MKVAIHLRFHQLQRIEKAIATLTKDKIGVKFTYYSLFAPKEKNKIVKRWIKYKSIINGFALAIVFLLIVNIVVKLSLYFMAN